MTKEQAIAELTRAAELCPTTPLAEACRYSVNWMLHPCKYCVEDDSWMPGEGKGVDNEQNRGAAGGGQG